MSAASLAFPRSPARSRKISFDLVLTLSTSALLLIGLIMVTSASVSVAEHALGNPFYYFEHQLMFVALGLVACAIAVTIPMHIWERLALPLMVIAFAMLVLVLIPGIGHSVNGSRRWARLGFMNFQVSELARVLLLIYVAGYAVRRQEEIKSDIKGFLKPLGLLMVAALLLLIEPDFGAATVLVATGLGILFLAGVKFRHFIALVTLAIVGMSLIAISSPYRVKRLIGFVDPWADPFNSGFQLTQSLIAIGRGEIFGVGLGASVQKLFYLPEAHTDFVFAVLAEEFGLIGIVVTLALFVILVGRSLHIARLAAQAGLSFQSYVAASFGLWVGLQTFVNVGVNMGLLPTKGLTLPLLSYGGSSLLVTLGWLGMVFRVAHETQLSGRSAMPKKERAT
jgi:cell division protein FtsW